MDERIGMHCRASIGALDSSRPLVASFRFGTEPTEAPVYLHLGFCKTGTKALQGSVFAKLDELHLWGNGPLAWAFNDAAQQRAIALLSEIVRSETWDAADPKWHELRTAATAPDGRISFASYEPLSGRFYNPRRDGIETLRRLHAVFPTLCVLLVVREQRSILMSSYADYVRLGGPAPRDRFVNGGIVEPTSLLYDEFVEELQAILGNNNVKVLLYEEYVKKPELFLADLAAFTGMRGIVELAESGSRRVHVSQSESSLTVLRCVNRCFVRSELQPRPILASKTLARFCYSAVERVVNPITRKLPQAARSRDEWIPHSVADRIAASNTALAVRCDLPLEEYGYLMR